jgi:hypothetical protein
MQSRSTRHLRVDDPIVRAASLESRVMAALSLAAIASDNWTRSYVARLRGHNARMLRGDQAVLSDVGSREPTS